MIVIEAPDRGPGQALFQELRKAALSRFAKSAQTAVGLDGAVNILLADDLRIKALNKAYRGKNKPTDVLSFPAADNGEGAAGDLAISVETAAVQAEEHGHTLETELRVLLLHGMLHLAGHNHEADAGEMRALEEQLRAKFKLPGGLIERTLTPAVRDSRNAGATRAAKSTRQISAARKAAPARKAATKRKSSRPAGKA